MVDESERGNARALLVRVRAAFVCWRLIRLSTSRLIYLTRAQPSLKLMTQVAHAPLKGCVKELTSVCIHVYYLRHRQLRSNKINPSLTRNLVTHGQVSPRPKEARHNRPRDTRPRALTEF